MNYEIWLQTIDLNNDIGGVVYKGITFDEVAVSMDNDKVFHLWANICEECLGDYPLLKGDSVNDGCCGICSVEGCWNEGEECKEAGEHDHIIYYIDFKPNKVQKIKIWYNEGEKYIWVDRLYLENELKRRHIIWE